MNRYPLPNRLKGNICFYYLDELISIVFSARKYSRDRTELSLFLMAGKVARY